MIIDTMSGAYGWTAVSLPYMADGVTLDASNTAGIIQQVKDVWMSGGNFSQAVVDSWHYVLVPYTGNMIGVLIFFEDICNGS